MKKVLFVRIAAIAVCIYCFINIVSLQTKIISLKNGELSELNQQKYDQQLKNQQLEDVVNSKLDEEFIEKIAREVLGYGAPGEKVYEDIAGN
ncbi:MAG: septum formation initiator family protein [Clostridia bacterium]|nr:septum formation initiator family protein [Clostridia bacterium]